MAFDVTRSTDLRDTHKTTPWEKQDTIWMLSLYGTAIGAGTLFLPINAGLHGIWPLLIMALLALPMTYYSHRALCRFILSGSGTKDITDVVHEHFGALAGNFITFLYFFAIYPILLMYSVAITNTTSSFMVHQLGIEAPPRALLSFLLILSLMLIIRFGERIIIKSMSILVYPFIFSLMLLAIYLIPNWSLDFFHSSVKTATNDQGFLKTLWLLIPVMVFSFNHSPIISSFAVSQKKRLGINADQHCNLLMKYSHWLMVGTVLFFVFSCVLSLSGEDLALAKEQNISILSYLANHFQTPVLTIIAPLIAFIAISKSFLGHYLGAKEGLYSLSTKLLRKRSKSSCSKKAHIGIEIFIFFSCWLVATVNPNILTMIETLGGPFIAMILFLMPMYAISKVPAMKQYKKNPSNVFVLVIGLVALSSILYGVINLICHFN